jgi:hypothetical protein
MRSIPLLATAITLAGCSMMPFGGSDADKPTAEAAPPARSVELAAPAPASHAYEIRHLVRGPVRRVKVLLEGRTIETLTMSKGRSEATWHCCTADGCETIALPTKTEPVKACSAFKMVCDVKGACKEDAPPKASSKI